MREVLGFIIICLVISAPTNGQNTNNLFADVNYAHGPGLSLIYNHTVANNCAVGIGGQLSHDSKYSVQKEATFFDLSSQWPINHNLLYIHCDVGIDFHKSYTTTFGTAPSATLFTGLGLGYAFFIDDLEPYVELRFWGDGYTGSQYDDPYQPPYRFYNMDVIPVLALGLKF